MKIALDTNVLVRLTNRDDARFGEVRNRVRSLTAEGHQLCTAAQCIYEYWSVATRPAERMNGLGLPTGEALRAVQSLLNAFEVLPDPPDLLSRWMYLCVRYDVKGRSSHDARIVAWMLACAADRLYTLNPSDFVRYEEITLLPER